MNQTGKNVTSRSCFKETILVMRGMNVRFQVLERLNTEKRFKVLKQRKSKQYDDDQKYQNGLPSS